MNNLRAGILPLVVLVTLFFLAACSKQDAGDQSSPLAGNTLLERIPDDSFGFATWNTDTGAYKKWKASAWSGDQVSKTFEDFARSHLPEDELKTPLVDSFTDFINALSGNSATSPLENAVFYIAGSKAKLEDTGAYYSTGTFGKITNHAKVEQIISKFSSEVSEQGTTVTEQNLGSARGFQLTIPLNEVSAEWPKAVEDSTAAQSGTLEGVSLTAEPKKESGSVLNLGELTLHLAYNNEFLGISTSLPELQGFFDDKKITTAWSRIKESSQYKKATRGVKFDDTLLSFSFIDLSLENVLSLDSLFNLEDEQAGSLKTLEHLYPLEAFTHTARIIGDSYQLNYGILVSPKNNEQQKWADALATNKVASGPASLPDDALLFVNLNGKIVNLIKDHILAEVPAEEVAQYKDELNALSSVENISVSISGASPGSFYPELTLALESSDPGSLIARLKKQISAATADSPMPMSDWQEKKLDKMDVSFLVSPLGIGVYLAQSDNLVFAASSEGTLRKIIDVQKKTKPALQDSFNKLVGSKTSQPTTLATYVDFGEIYRTLESLKGTIAMFTGGAEGFDMSELQILEQLNSMLYSCNYVDDTLKCDFYAKL